MTRHCLAAVIQPAKRHSNVTQSLWKLPFDLEGTSEMLTRFEQISLCQAASTQSVPGLRFPGVHTHGKGKGIKRLPALTFAPQCQSQACSGICGARLQVKDLVEAAAGVFRLSLSQARHAQVVQG